MGINERAVRIYFLKLKKSFQLLVNIYPLTTVEHKSAKRPIRLDTGMAYSNSSGFLCTLLRVPKSVAFAGGRKTSVPTLAPFLK